MTITSEDYVVFLRRRLEAIQVTAGEALNESRRHRWSKNLGVKDRDMLEKIQRDLGHIIRYSSIERLEVEDGQEISSTRG
jgi:hypothetical protein